MRNARGKHHTGHLVHKLSFKLMDELLDKVDRCHLHGNEFFHQHMPIHNAGDWARERAGGAQRPSNVASRCGVAQGSV